MNKTFATMKSNVGLELQDTTTAFNTLVGKFINRRYFQVLRSIVWDSIRPDYTLATVSGTQDYALPRDFGRAVYCIDSTNNITYKEVRFDEYVHEPKSIFDEGTTHSYTIFDSCVKVQPTAASVVTVVSDSASDTATAVQIRGEVGGAETSETITLSGTTPVNGTKSFTRIKSITKDATSGMVTITCNSQTIAVMDAELAVNRVKMLRLFPIPSAVVTLSIPYHVNPLPLTNDDDTPIIDIDDLLECGARADGWRYKRQGQKATVEERLFDIALTEYQWAKDSNPNLTNEFKPVAYPRD